VSHSETESVAPGQPLRVSRLVSARAAQKQLGVSRSASWSARAAPSKLLRVDSGFEVRVCSLLSEPGTPTALAQVNLTSGYAMCYPFSEILHVMLIEVEVMFLHQIARVHAHEYTTIIAVGLARDTAFMLRVNCTPR
jgi:hypothetical protein